jgi:hypothetical protein
LEKAYNVLHSPAARQMMIYAYDDYNTWNSSTRWNFQYDLNNIGLPTTTVQNIAIANGNGVGNGQNFDSLDELLNADIQNNVTTSMVNPTNALAMSTQNCSKSLGSSILTRS